MPRKTIALFIWDVDKRLSDYLMSRLDQFSNIDLIFPSHPSQKEYKELAPNANIIVGWRPTKDLRARICTRKVQNRESTHLICAQAHTWRHCYVLNVRRFIEGEDEEAWLRIQNAAYREYEDVRPDTMEDMEISKRSPSFDATGMFIAELDGKPVGLVNAFIDKHRKEMVGSLRVLGVVPEFRGRGVGRCLVETAIESLKERGIESVQGWTRECAVSCKSLLEGMGFTLTRMFCSMRADLKKIPYDIGEHENLMIREMEISNDDIELVRWLHNETFKGQFRFRPRTSEEYKYWLTHTPWGCDTIGAFISYLDEKPVGFVETGIDSKFIEHKGIKRGWILSTGVLKPNRRKGIGTALMQQAMEFLKSKGLTNVEPGVDASNPTKAIELYKKMGFKIIRRNLAYIKKIRG